jgi:predicted amidohydrolase YtcJ
MRVVIRPSLVLFARAVHTMDPEHPFAAAVAVDGPAIVAVGSRAEAVEWDLSEAKVIDLPDGVAVPGFVDAHTHPLKGAVRRWGTVDLSRAATMAEIRARIAAIASTKAPDVWVLGHSLDFSVFDGRQIGSDPFEDAFGGHPGYLMFFDAHAMVANRRALELAGITGAREFGNASRIAVDDDGLPTGYLVEDAMALVTTLVPPLSFEERKAAVRSALDAFAAAGYTGVHQLNLEDGDLDLLRALEADAELPVRIRISPMWRSTDDWESALQRVTGLQNTAGRRWVVQGVKLMLDGTVENGSAWLREPDTDGGGLVPLWMPPERFTRTVHALASRGIPTATHAIGDRAVEFALAAIGSVPGGEWQVVHRIEHVETLPDDLVDRFAELGVAASMQPTHMLGVRTDQTDLWSTKLGRGSVRASRGWRIKDLVDSGATVALGSDWPVVDSDPREVLAASHLSPQASIRALTQQVWASIGRPQDGMIRPGSIADFTVLDGDPLEATREQLVAMPVRMTIVDGVVVNL